MVPLTWVKSRTEHNAQHTRNKSCIIYRRENQKTFDVFTPWGKFHTPSLDTAELICQLLFDSHEKEPNSVQPLNEKLKKRVIRG